MIKQKREVDTYMSFLDVICCGFGAIVLLLMILKTGSSTPTTSLQDSDTPLNLQVRQLQEALFKIRGEISHYEKELNAKQQQLSKYKTRVAVLVGEKQKLSEQFAKKDSKATTQQAEEAKLKIALQKLDSVLKRLKIKKPNNHVGGIPADSEYIIFIIDTSGSMYSVAWQRMLKEIKNILNIYPNVKGIQVMNDMGDYLFSSFKRKWIKDSPARRRSIVKVLATAPPPFSNSSPVEGIAEAIKTFYSSNRRMSLYFLGDDFSGNINQALTLINTLNKKNTKGQSLVRIHTIGFPVNYSQTGNINTHFAALIRKIAEQNNGAFIGLNSVK